MIYDVNYNQFNAKFSLNGVIVQTIIFATRETPFLDLDVRRVMTPQTTLN